ncbi:hypothetical protein [Streptococcus sp. DD12]|uniref:hypothetical protein n=1 Tax=Streptococcus sp. DD12 TaxID=1777880 RepID=UPI00079367B0|nr:hypothetical protein [Streptococcus sp. DD12]KXT75328.1 hypothetical protein STRDD12_01449 [Streptococcus sp. DD12]
MMSREEWLDYFETVNGRKPSEEEIKAAQAVGEFSVATDQPVAQETSDASANIIPSEPVQADGPIEKRPPVSPVGGVPVAGQPFQQVPANQGPFGQQQAPVGPYQTGVPTYVMPSAKRKGKIGLIIGLVAGVLVLLGLGVGGVFGFRYMTGWVPDGTFTSTAITKDIEDAQDEVDDYPEVQDVISKPKLQLTVDDKDVAVSLTYQFDWDTYWKNYLSILKQELKSSYGDYVSDTTIDSYVESNYASSESTYKSKYLTELKTQIQDAGGMFDKSTGEVSFLLVRGKLDYLSHKMTVTSVNTDALRTKVGKDYTTDYLASVYVNKLSTYFANLSEGKEVDYSYNDGDLEIGNVTYSR